MNAFRQSDSRHTAEKIMGNKLRTVPILLVSGLVASLVWWLFPGGQNPIPNNSVVNDTPVIEAVAATVPTPAAEHRAAVRRSPTAAVGSGATRAEHLLAPEEARGQSFRPEDYKKNRMQIYSEFQRAVRTWTPEIFDQKTQQLGTLNGEQTYEVYVYLRSCLDSLRNVDGYQKRAQAMEQYHLRQPDDFLLEDLQNTLESYRLDLARCEGVGEDLGTELELLLTDWLTLAAERGYPQAQLAYHQSIRWLLTRQAMTVYRNPQLLREYRQRAPAYLRAALHSGHSEALVEYSLALQEGVLFEKDLELAFAYARAADLAASGGNETARHYMAIQASILDPGAIAAARQRGRELCDQWCR